MRGAMRPSASMANSSATWALNFTGSRAVNAPQNTPHTSHDFSSVRLSGSRAMPAGKPTTQNRPSHAIARRAGSE